jgi:hypothetical protein
VITFKVNGKPYNFPTRWQDVTYSQYIALLRTHSITDHIHIFTGIPKETLENAEIKNLEKISIALSFLSFTPKFERITKMVGPYVLPSDVTVHSVGQFEELRKLLMKLPKDTLTVENMELVADLYLHACAVYVQKIKHGKWDEERVLEVKEELKNYSCAEVISTGAFFLFKPLNSSPPTKTIFQRLIQLLRSPKRV